MSSKKATAPKATNPVITSVAPAVPPKSAPLGRVLLGVIVTLIGTFVLMFLGIALRYLVVNSAMQHLNQDLTQGLQEFSQAKDLNLVSVTGSVALVPPIVVEKVNWLVDQVNEHVMQKYFKTENGVFLFDTMQQPKPFQFAITPMHIPIICVMIVLVYTILSKLPVSVAQAVVGRGNYNNATPRAQQAKLTGWGLRALGGHQNAVESFAPFAAAVIFYMLRFGLFMTVNDHNISFGVALIKDCLAFVAFRTVYHVLYILNLAMLRSIVWFAGFSCVFNLFLITLSTNNPLSL